MTYEDFKQIALNPPRRDEDTVFIVTMLKIDELPEHQHVHYPKFYVTEKSVGSSLNLSDAEKLIQSAIKFENKRGLSDKIYCFHVKEYPLNLYEPDWPRFYGVSWRLYDYNGELMDHTWCSATERDFDTEYGKFRGRPAESIRFKTGDIVEIYDEHNSCVRLAVATQSPVDIDWCWRYRGRCLEVEGLTDGNEPADGNEWFYGLDFSDDQAAVIDGPGYEYHEHIPTLSIMPLRFSLSDKLRRRYEGFWEASQKQNEQSK